MLSLVRELNFADPPSLNLTPGAAGRVLAWDIVGAAGLGHGGRGVTKNTLINSVHPSDRLESLVFLAVLLLKLALFWLC